MRNLHIKTTLIVFMMLHGSSSNTQELKMDRNECPCIQRNGERGGFPHESFEQPFWLGQFATVRKRLTQRSKLQCPGGVPKFSERINPEKRTSRYISMWTLLCLYQTMLHKRVLHGFCRNAGNWTTKNQIFSAWRVDNRPWEAAFLHCSQSLKPERLPGEWA